MIPILFPSNATDFTTEGLGRLSDCISAVVTEERNGAFELVIEMPCSGAHFDEIALGSIIVARPSPTRNRQAFDVYCIEESSDNMLATIYCQHISYRLSMIPVMPFAATTLADALAGLKTHSQEANPFTFLHDGSGTGTYKQTTPSSVKNRLLGEQGSVIQTFRGIEYLWDNFTVHALHGRGVDRGVKIIYGKNLINLKQEQNIQETITGVLPYWQSEDANGTTVVTLPEKILYTDNAAAFPFHRTVTVDFSGEFQEKPTEAQLRERTQRYITENGLGIPKVSLDITPAALAQMADYADIGLLERVELCDTVEVVFPPFNVTASAEVVKTVYNVLEDKYDSYEIGSQTTTLGATIASTGASIQEASQRDRNYFQQALAAATAIINGDITGSRMITITDADGNPQGLIIMDTDDPATAVNCIRFNTNGIGFSNQGVNGPYSSAWTINNELNMDQINVKGLTGDKITAGTIEVTKLDSSAQGQIENGVTAYQRKNAIYCTCDSLASATTKSVTIPEVDSIETGMVLNVTFTNGNTANGLYLTVHYGSRGYLTSGTIVVADARTSADNRLLWAAGATLTFVKGVSGWYYADAPMQYISKECTTSAGASPKSLTIADKFVLCKGTTVAVKMKYENTYGGTYGSTVLIADASINGSTIFYIPILDGASADTPTTANGKGWFAGSTIYLDFDGKNFRLRDGNGTIIDGDHIKTGTIDASVVNVTNINASNINTGSLSASLIKTGTLDASLINVTNLVADHLLSYNTSNTWKLESEASLLTMSEYLNGSWQERIALYGNTRNAGVIELKSGANTTLMIHPEYLNFMINGVTRIRLSSSALYFYDANGNVTNFYPC